jgi:hypothetical protein
MVAAIYDWSGFYVGANGGRGSIHEGWDFTTPSSSFETRLQRRPAYFHAPTTFVSTPTSSALASITVGAARPSLDTDRVFQSGNPNAARSRRDDIK